MVDVIIARLFGALIFGSLMALGFGSCSQPPIEDADTTDSQEIFTYLDTATCRAPWTLHD